MWLFRKKHLFPRWFSEIHRGNLKCQIGQDLASTGEPELVVQYLRRENYGKYKVIGRVRFLDFPYLKELEVDIERYVRSLISHS